MGPGLSQLLTAPLFVVECYWPGVTTEQLKAADERIHRALAQSTVEKGETAVRQVGSVLIPTDELVLRLYVGGSPELVEAANQQAAIPFERVVGAVALDAPIA